MKSIRLTLTIIAAAVGALVASAQQASAPKAPPAGAFISFFSGEVMVTLPGATAAVPVILGDSLPEGSVVTTGPDGSALVESFAGISTGVSESSSVVIGKHSVSAEGVRTAEIELKEGSTVSVLDPAKRKINNYGVRTPKGVAAARGTTYSTSFRGGVMTVNTATGEVLFTDAKGVASPKPVNAANFTKREARTLIMLVAIIAKLNPAEQGRLATVKLLLADKFNAGEVDKIVGEAQSKVSDEAINQAKASADSEDKKVVVTTKQNSVDITIVSPAQ
jgi:hypothetical protein